MSSCEDRLTTNHEKNVVRRVDDCQNGQSVVEGRWGREGGCTCVVQYQGLVDGAESVDFVNQAYLAI